jgi:hypothetical protein
MSSFGSYSYMVAISNHLKKFISYIQLRCLHRFILCVFVFLVYQILQSLSIIYSPSFLLSCNDTCAIILQWSSNLSCVWMCCK